MKKIWTTLCAFLFFVLLSACAPSTADKWQEQYDLGIRYLSESNYEQAIIAFESAIEIDNKNELSYIGLSNAYLSIGNYSDAIKILDCAVEQCGETESLSQQKEQLLQIIATLDPEQAEALSPDNLTGETKFSVKDCEEWGYPYQCTLFDLQKKGLATDSNPEEIIEQAKQTIPDWGTGGYHGTTVQYENPEIAVYTSTEDLYVWYIKETEAGDFTGPRGIAVGQTLQDVISRFYCENTYAIEYAETLSLDIAQKNFEKRDDGSLSASLWDRNGNTPNRFASLLISENGKSTLDYYGDTVGLIIEFENNIAVSYTVVYHKPWEA